LNPEVINCPACGAKLRAARRRCPRCRARIARPDPAVAAAASRKLARIAAGMLAGFVVLLAALWLARDPEPSAPFAITTTDPFAARRSADTAVSPQTTEPQRAGENANASPDSQQATQAAGSANMDAALAYYQDAIGRNPADADSFSNLGQILLRLNRPADALPHLQRAMELKPDTWAYTVNMGRALGSLGRWHDAVAMYRRAQALLPDDGGTTFKLAEALREWGDVEAAVAEFEKAIALDPKDATFRIALGRALESLGRPVEAAAAYEEGLGLAPNTPEADTVRKRIAQLRGG
jgi:tetratricopeptide (TPR) repeat protein